MSEMKAMEGVIADTLWRRDWRHGLAYSPR